MEKYQLVNVPGSRSAQKHRSFELHFRSSASTHTMKLTQLGRIKDYD